MYNKLKKQNGEAFAKAIRNYHNGILEIPNLDVMLRFAGREAEPLIPYLISLLLANPEKPSATEDPFDLLKKAGYDAFHADTLEKQNSIRRYFAKGELLCTFNDAARHKNFHIVHAVKEGAEKLNRADFQGKEARQDAYGTSVISIQMMKGGGFISIKNRYNDTVANCDNTFNSNPDNIIDGLSEALKSHFNVDFSASKTALPEGYALFDKQIFRYHKEYNNIYYGDQAWVEGCEIKTVNRSAGDALFDGFLFNNKTKTLQKIDKTSQDSFADDFNACYGGRSGLHVKNGHLMLGDERLIGAEESRIKTISLPELTTMRNGCLIIASALTHFSAPALTTMGAYCLYEAEALTHFSAPVLTTMGNHCLCEAEALTHFSAPVLTTMGDDCLCEAKALTHFSAPVLTTMGNDCLLSASALTHFSAPVLTTMGDYCLYEAEALTHFSAPSLITMGDYCLRNPRALTHFSAPVLTTMGNNCLHRTHALTHFSAPVLTTMGNDCLHRTHALTHFSAPVLTTMGNDCLLSASALTHFSAPSLITMGDYCLANVHALTYIFTPKIKTAPDPVWELLQKNRPPAPHSAP